MNNKLYVGQLSFGINSDQLADIFAEAGEVLTAKVITDRDTGRSKGFGFVEMSDAATANSAIEMFNGKEVSGRSITVSIAKPMEKTGGGGGGGRSGGGGGRGFGGGGGGGFRRGY